MFYLVSAARPAASRFRYARFLRFFFGVAAVCFREALRLDPEDEDARDFLGFIRRKGDTVNKVGGKKGGKVQ